MFRFYRWRRRREPSVICRILFISLTVFILLTILFERVSAAVQNNLIENRALVIVEQTVNEAVAASIAENSVESLNFVKLDYSSSGEVSTITTNSAAVNFFKARIDSAIQNELEKIHITNTKIPIGAFTGINIFSAAGPEIDFTYYLTASFNSTLNSYFDSGGINQTVHHIELQLDALVTLVCLGHDTQIPFSTNFEIAQTVIAGAVPNTYVNANDFNIK